MVSGSCYDHMIIRSERPPKTARRKGTLHDTSPTSRHSRRCEHVYFSGGRRGYTQHRSDCDVVAVAEDLLVPFLIDGISAAFPEASTGCIRCPPGDLSARLKQARPAQ